MLNVELFNAVFLRVFSVGAEISGLPKIEAHCGSDSFAKNSTYWYFRRFYHKQCGVVLIFLLEVLSAHRNWDISLTSRNKRNADNAVVCMAYSSCAVIGGRVDYLALAKLAITGRMPWGIT